MNREAWLLDAVEQLRPIFTEAGEELPEHVRVSVGWPGGRGKKNNVVGQCWNGAAAEDGIPQVFISPVVKESVQVLDILVHELIHAFMPAGTKHQGKFIEVAKAVGLVKPWTATTASPELAARLTEIAEGLGEYPHAVLNAAVGGPPKQSTRMLKVECPDCGYIVRTTAKWLEMGTPTCPCGTEMEAV